MGEGDTAAPSPVVEGKPARRPVFFSRKRGEDNIPGMRDLRLVLNKLTPSSEEKQIPALLALEFNEDLIKGFETLLLTKVAEQKAPVSTLATFATCCVRLRDNLRRSCGTLANYLVSSLDTRLQEEVLKALETEQDKLNGLLGMVGALAATGFSPGVFLFQSFDLVLSHPSEEAVETVCFVFKHTVREVLAVEDVKTRAKSTMDTLTDIWRQNILPKKTQFHLQNLLDEQDKLLTPVHKIVELPVIIRKSSNRARKKVTFVYPPEDGEEESPLASPAPESSAKVCLSPICRTFIASETKVCTNQLHINGILRQLMESHNIEEAERSLGDMLKTIDLPAISEMVLHMFKYMLRDMSQGEYVEVCQVLQHLLETSPDMLLKSDVEDG